MARLAPFLWGSVRQHPVILPPDAEPRGRETRWDHPFVSRSAPLAIAKLVRLFPRGRIRSESREPCSYLWTGISVEAPRAGAPPGHFVLVTGRRTDADRQSLAPRIPGPDHPDGIVTLAANLIFHAVPRRVAADPGVWPSATRRACSRRASGPVYLLGTRPE